MSEEQQTAKQLTAIAPERQRPLAKEGFTFLPRSFEELWNYAKEIAATDFVPRLMVGKPGAVLACWQTGQEIGLPPMASLQSIAIINGRPSVHSDGYWALIVSHSMCEWFKETPPDEAASQGYGECTIKRRGNPHPITRRFSIEEARTAKLLEKDNYKFYLGDMLQNRARHRAGSDAIPEATQGVLPSDVARDLPPLEVEIEKEKPIALPTVKEKEDGKTKRSDGGTKGITGDDTDIAEGHSDNDEVRAVQRSIVSDGIRTENKTEVEKEEPKVGSRLRPRREKPKELPLKDDLMAWIKSCPYDVLMSFDKKVSRVCAEAMSLTDPLERQEVLAAWDIERRTREEPREPGVEG